MEQGLIPNVWQALSSDSLTYRACRNRSERDKQAGRARTKLFYRRSDESGLSVGLTLARAACIRHEGIFQLEVGDIRAHGALHVAQDEEDHAEIQGMPVFQEDEERALEIAGHLARHARPAVDL